jgi:hypothetical protein
MGEMTGVARYRRVSCVYTKRPAWYHEYRSVMKGVGYADRQGRSRKGCFGIKG